MKKIIIVALTLAAALLISPYFIGAAAKTEIESTYQDINKQSSVTVDLEEYQQGWFSSEVVARITFDTPPSAAIQTLTIKQTVYHGPILWRTNGLGLGLAETLFDLELPKDMQTALKEFESINKDTLTLNMRIGFNGATTAKLALAPFKIIEQNKAISVKTGELNASISSDGHLLANGNWQGFTVTEDEQSAFNLSQLTISSDQKLLSGNIFSATALTSGEISVKLEQLSAQSLENSENIEMQDLHFFAKSEVSQDLMNIKLKLAAASIKTGEQKLSDFIYDIDIANLDLPSMTKLNQLAAEPAFQANPHLLSAEVQSLMPQIIAKNPSLKINQLGMVTEQGIIHSQLDIDFDQTVYNPENPMTLFFAINADASGIAPEAFFNQLKMQSTVDELLMKQVIVRDNDQLKFNFILKQGSATLNGQVIPLDQL